jgi:hypothetical protein
VWSVPSISVAVLGLLYYHGTLGKQKQKLLLHDWSHDPILAKYAKSINLKGDAIGFLRNVNPSGSLLGFLKDLFAAL